jgi:hypothetical protein
MEIMKKWKSTGNLQSKKWEILVNPREEILEIHRKSE